MDPDVGFTFEGNFNIGPGESGSVFCFPDYSTKVVLRSKERLEIFVFNSAIKVNKLSFIHKHINKISLAWS